jgi:hypothetical protein
MKPINIRSMSNITICGYTVEAHDPFQIHSKINVFVYVPTKLMVQTHTRHVKSIVANWIVCGLEVES